AKRPVLGEIASVHVIGDAGITAAHRTRVRPGVSRFEESLHKVALEHLERSNGRAVELTQAIGNWKFCLTGNSVVACGDAALPRIPACEPCFRGITRQRVSRKTLLTHEVPTRGAARTLFREDLDDAGGCFGPVKRRRRSALQHLHMVNRFRIDVVEPRGCAASSGTDVVT